MRSNPSSLFPFNWSEFDVASNAVNVRCRLSQIFHPRRFSFVSLLARVYSTQGSSLLEATGSEHGVQLKGRVLSLQVKHRHVSVLNSSLCDSRLSTGLTAARLWQFGDYRVCDEASRLK